MQKIVFSSEKVDKFINYLSTKNRSIPVNSKNSCCQKQIFCNRLSVKFLKFTKGKYFKIVTNYDNDIKTYVGFIYNGKSSSDNYKTYTQHGPICYYLGYGEEIYIPFYDLQNGAIDIKLKVYNNFMRYNFHISELTDIEIKNYIDIVLPKFEEKAAVNINNIFQITSEEVLKTFNTQTIEAFNIFKNDPTRDNAHNLKFSLEATWSDKNNKGEYIWPQNIKLRGKNYKQKCQNFLLYNNYREIY
jgi:hypothetical protein